MAQDMPIDRWRKAVRDLMDRGLTAEAIAAKLGCNAELVRIQIKVWETDGEGE